MIRRLLAVVAAASLLALAGGWFWLGSDGGRQWLAATVASSSNGSLEISGLTGHPLSGIEADLVLFKSPEAEVAVESLTLVWSPWRLIFGELAIDVLKAGKIGLQLSESQPAGQPDEPLELPALVARLEALRIAELVVTGSDGVENRISDIRLDGLLLSRSLAGDLQAHHAEGDLTLQLAGTLDNWLVTGDLKGGKQGSAGYSFSGRYLQKGSVKLAIDSDAGSGRLDALWQRDERELTAEGEMRLQADAATFAGPWRLAAPVDFSSLALNIEGLLTSEERLGRPLPLDIGVAWASEGLTGSVEERGNGLRLEWRYTGEQVEGALALNRWVSPLKEAPGQLSGRLNGAWRLADRQWRLQGDIDRGELAGVVASLKLDGKGDADNWRLDRADIRALGLDMKLSGHGDMERFSVSGTMSTNDVGPALAFAGLKGAAGRLSADIKLAGSYDAPGMTASGDASALKLATYAMAAASFSVRHASGSGSYRLMATGLSVEESREMERLSVDARLQAGKLNLDLASEGRLELRAKLVAGIGAAGRSEGVISDLRFAYDKLTLLEAERLPLRLEGESLHLAKSTIRLLGAAASCNLDFTPESVSARLHMPDFNISGDEPWFRDSPYHVTGHVGLSFTLSGTPSVPLFAATLVSPALHLRHAMFRGEADRMLELSDIRLGLDYRKRMLAWKLQAAAPAGTSLKGSGQGAMLLSLKPWQLEFPEAERDSGTFSATLGRLSDLQPLLPRIDPFEGSGSLDLSWATPPTITSVRGNANIAFDAIGVPEFGLEMKGALLARLEKGRPFVDLRLSGGDGELSLRGPVDIGRRTMPDIRFNRFPLMQLPDQQLAVSGTITALERQQVSVIKGSLEVVRLRLEIPDPVPGPTGDLQWKQDEEQEAARGKTPLTEIDLDLAIGDDAEISGRGMSLKPKGKLHLGGSLSQPKLTGVLEIAGGRIEFRSVKLDILSGSRVIFSGDPKRPSIHVKAARKVDDITAGVLVEGPADQLQSRLFSEPSMSDAEILSYIATGRPLASLGKDKAGDMMTAAEFILGPGTMMQEMQGKVQQATGLDVFEVSGDTSGGQVRAGRKLSEDITVTVEQTVSKEATTALTLEYMLTRSVSVFARQTMNMAPRVGLRYSKEWFGSPEPKGGVKKVRGE